MKKLMKLTAVALTFAMLASGSALAAEKVRVTGSGASFPFPIYSTWFKTYSRANKGIIVDYQAKGSGAGIRDFINHTVDFAASDAAMKDSEIAQIEEGVQLLPMIAGEIVLAYNLDGVKELKLSRQAYADIFLGKLKNWNDPVIAAANPGVTLPDTPITVVRRADSSGTTYVFTTHLSAISEDWKNGPGIGKTVDWPSNSRMVAAPKNDGVTATIKQTPGAIGYIEYGYAKMAKVPMAAIENKAGEFIQPSLEGGQAALANATIPADMRVWLPDPEGDAAYPMVTYTWMCFYKKYDDPAKAKVLKDVINFCLTDGQKMADKLGYIPLPANVVEVVQRAARNIQ
ncbi:MAG: phosphate ABC transporter substrate-binding protein PstS [Deltaproteobacteria bacterium]|nr:phosphate ABC transporter substrate-binding protein PstS [Candidatus Anaeroferrophillacea bacterium]